MKKEIKEKKVRRSFKVWFDDNLHSFAYWFVQIALSVLAVSGTKMLLQPVDPVISNTISVTLVACLLYITYRNR